MKFKVCLTINYYPKNLFLNDIFSCSIVKKNIKAESKTITLICAKNHVVFINLF